MEKLTSVQSIMKSLNVAAMSCVSSNASSMLRTTASSTFSASARAFGHCDDGHHAGSSGPSWTMEGLRITPVPRLRDKLGVPASEPLPVCACCWNTSDDCGDDVAGVSRDSSSSRWAAGGTHDGGDLFPSGSSCLRSASRSSGATLVWFGYSGFSHARLRGRGPRGTNTGLCGGAAASPSSGSARSPASRAARRGARARARAGAKARADAAQSMRPSGGSGSGSTSDGPRPKGRRDAARPPSPMALGRRAAPRRVVSARARKPRGGGGGGASRRRGNGKEAASEEAAEDGPRWDSKLQTLLADSARPDEVDGLVARALDAVVKVYCSHTEPDFSLPWQRNRQVSSTSTGFALPGRRLLTNAHSVEYSTQVKVKRRGDDQRFVAHVEAYGAECDLALLRVDDDRFWAGLSPLNFGPLPRLQDEAFVVGYPVGGDTLSITAGVVSRIEVTNYLHGQVDLLGVQIDAAINSGNSGGPVFDATGDCVGVAFQSMAGDADAENIGWVIPTPVIAHFLADVERNGAYTGFPQLGIDFQRLEAPALRGMLRMQPHHKGILVRRVVPTSASAAVIRPGDVLLQFDGENIGLDGTVPFRTGERVSFSYLVTQKFVGEPVEVLLLRDGAEIRCELALSQPAPLIPPHLGGRTPSYLVVAGLVFTPASEPFLEAEYGEEYLFEASVRLLSRLFYTLPQVEGQQTVVLSQVLAADVNTGYEGVSNVEVLRFNGVEILTIQQLALLVEGCDASHMVFELADDALIVLETDAVRAATPDVLATHSIPSAVSADVQQALDLARAEAAEAAVTQ